MSYSQQQMDHAIAQRDTARQERDSYQTRLTVANDALRKMNRIFSLAALNDQRAIEGLPLYDDNGRAAP